MNLEMVSDWREHPSEASVKVSSRSDTRNHVKINLSSRSFPVVLEDMDILDEPGDGSRLEVTSIRSFCESFMTI